MTNDEILMMFEEEEKKKPKKQRLEEQIATYERLKKSCEKQISIIKKKLKNYKN